LDEDSVAERLANVERMTRGSISASDTAGLRQIARTREIAITELEILELGYSHQKQRRAA
jgi:hypothetical protein